MICFFLVADWNILASERGTRSRILPVAEHLFPSPFKPIAIIVPHVLWPFSVERSLLLDVQADTFSECPGRRPAARGKPGEPLSDDREQMVLVWNVVGLWHSLSDIQNQARLVPGALELRILASLMLGECKGERSPAAHGHCMLWCKAWCSAHLLSCPCCSSGPL